jgi:hypothetical protein
MLPIQLPMRHFDAVKTQTKMANFLVDSVTATTPMGTAIHLQQELNGLLGAFPGACDHPP